MGTDCAVSRSGCFSAISETSHQEREIGYLIYLIYVFSPFTLFLQERFRKNVMDLNLVIFGNRDCPRDESRAGEHKYGTKGLASGTYNLSFMAGVDSSTGKNSWMLRSLQ